LVIVSFFICGCAAVTAGEPALVNTPVHEYTNVILISIDTLRNDHLGCYGYRRKTSPHIDRLAKRAVLFENFITQANLTPISQMSILTAQYPRANGMIEFESSEADVTGRRLPEILKYYDYYNAAFLSSIEFYKNVKLSRTGALIPARSVFEKHFDVYEPTRKNGDIPWDALGWIKRNKEKKFFLWLPLGSVHWPYSWMVPEADRKVFDPPRYSPFFRKYGAFPNANKDYMGIGILSRIYRGEYYCDFSPAHRLTKEDVAFIIARYDAGIRYTDMFIGRLLSVLEKQDLMDKTLIILHSVHGEDLGEHGYFQHYDIYDTEVKNALLIKFPGNKFRGKRIFHQVQGIDIVPTLLDYLQIPLDESFQGRSVTALIKNTDVSQINEFAYTSRIPLWEFVLSRYLLEWYQMIAMPQVFTKIESKKHYPEMLKEYFGTFPEYRYPPYDIAIRTNRWKLLWRKDPALQEKISWWGFISGKNISRKEIELYDLTQDPFERTDVAAAYPEVAAMLKEKLVLWDNKQEAGRSPGANRDSRERSIIPYP